MNFQDTLSYALPLAFVAYMGWRSFRFNQAKAQIPRLLEGGAIIIDVRSPGEYASGASLHSINIPLDQLNAKVNKLDKSKPIILCCASGSRSGMAATFLKRNGFSNVLNAGPWRNVP